MNKGATLNHINTATGQYPLMPTRRGCTMRQYILDRLSEPSTWRGLTLLATALGVQIAPEMQEAIIAAGIAVAGLVGVAAKG